MTAKRPGPVAAEQAQIISPLPPCLIGGLRCLCWYAVFGFLQMCCCALWANISAVVSSVQNTLFQKSCGLFRWNFASLSCAAMFFFQERMFSPTTLPNKPYLFSFFLIVLALKLIFNMLTEACRVWDAAFGFYAVSLSTAHSDLGVNLTGMTTPGKIDSCLKCFPLVNNLCWRVSSLALC